MVGLFEGLAEGLVDGSLLGLDDGVRVGSLLGEVDGCLLGDEEGDFVGGAVGCLLGLDVGCFVEGRAAGSGATLSNCESASAIQFPTSTCLSKEKTNEAWLISSYNSNI